VIYDSESTLTFSDYLDDFTDFLAMFAGWGVVVVVVLTLLVLIARQVIIGGWPKRLQRVTIELYIAFAMIIFRPIYLRFILHRPDLPQPTRVIFWLIVFVLCWKFFYFALWEPWLRPALLGVWHLIVRPRWRQFAAIAVALLTIAALVLWIVIGGVEGLASCSSDLCFWLS
jgi:hypothetical protein